MDYGSSPDIFVANLADQVNAKSEIEAFDGVAIRECNMQLVTPHSWILMPVSMQMKIIMN